MSLTGAYEKATLVECISLEEVLVEKLISFPRRLASLIDKESDHWDHALVRHLYDVFRIRSIVPDALEDKEKLGRVLHKVIAQDAVEFPNHVQFIDDPRDALMRALDHARTSSDIRGDYKAFCIDMIYGIDIPSFDQALNLFQDTLTLLPDSLGQGVRNGWPINQNERHRLVNSK